MPLQFVNGQWIDSATGRPVNTLMGGPVTAVSTGAPPAGQPWLGPGAGTLPPGVNVNHDQYGAGNYDPNFANTPEGQQQIQAKLNPQEESGKDPGGSWQDPGHTGKPTWVPSAGAGGGGVKPPPVIPPTSPGPMPPSGGGRPGVTGAMPAAGAIAAPVPGGNPNAGAMSTMTSRQGRPMAGPGMTAPPKLGGIGLFGGRPGQRGAPAGTGYRTGMFGGGRI